MENTTNYLGIAGIVSLDKDNTIKYNLLLDKIGAEGMLIQFERFINDEMLSDLIEQVEENISTNNKINNQIELLKVVMGGGINLVTCGDCGEVLLHRLRDTEITCPYCNFTSEPCDFPDLIIEKFTYKKLK
jgi:hypothetical protein